MRLRSKRKRRSSNTSQVTYVFHFQKKKLKKKYWARARSHSPSLAFNTESQSLAIIYTTDEKMNTQKINNKKFQLDLKSEWPFSAYEMIIIPFSSIIFFNFMSYRMFLSTTLVYYGTFQNSDFVVSIASQPKQVGLWSYNVFLLILLQISVIHYGKYVAIWTR